jgi:hypothetical protein
MRLRIPSAAKALFALTAAGLVLSGCYYDRARYGGPSYGPPGYGFQHHKHGEGRRQGNRHHDIRRGNRGYH